MIPTLSKSQYVKGLQCPKALWFYRHRKDLKPEIDPETQARFDTGNQIGLLAQQYFLNGVEVTADYWDIESAELSTKQYVADGHDIIFEATAINPVDGTYSRIDILRRVRGSNAWELIEVKSSTTVKPYHIDDVSLQYHAFTQAGYSIHRCFMMVIDNTYVRDGDVDPKKLFRFEDISELVVAKKNEVEQRALELINVLASETQPEAQIGSRCKIPFECDYKAHCWKGVPEYSVFNIYRGKKADEIAKLTNSYDVADIPADLIPGGNKQIDIICFKEQVSHTEKECIESFLQQLKYPLYYLDYETLGPAIPLFNGTRPYQQTPFQFSLHVQEEPESELRHYEFIHKATSDPRKTFAESLIKHCRNCGSIIVYKQSFEEGCNIKLAEELPKYAQGLLKINQRMLDLLIPFSKRWLYHPDQMGSASLKFVLPALTDLNYEDMGIAGGMEASRQYQAFVEGKLSEEEIVQLWNDLSTYCERDTFAMVALVEVLRRLP